MVYFRYFAFDGYCNLIAMNYNPKTSSPTAQLELVHKAKRRIVLGQSLTDMDTLSDDELSPWTPKSFEKYIGHPHVLKEFFEEIEYFIHWEPLCAQPTSSEATRRLYYGKKGLYLESTFLPVDDIPLSFSCDPMTNRPDGKMNANEPDTLSHLKECVAELFEGTIQSQGDDTVKPDGKPKNDPPSHRDPRSGENAVPYNHPETREIRQENFDYIPSAKCGGDEHPYVRFSDAPKTVMSPRMPSSSAVTPRTANLPLPKSVPKQRPTNERNNERDSRQTSEDRQCRPNQTTGNIACGLRCPSPEDMQEISSFFHSYESFQYHDGSKPPHQSPRSGILNSMLMRNNKDSESSLRLRNARIPLRNVDSGQVRSSYFSNMQKLANQTAPLSTVQKGYRTEYTEQSLNFGSKGNTSDLLPTSSLGNPGKTSFSEKLPADEVSRLPLQVSEHDLNSYVSPVHTKETASPKAERLLPRYANDAWASRYSVKDNESKLDRQRNDSDVACTSAWSHKQSECPWVPRKPSKQTAWDVGHPEQNCDSRSVLQSFCSSVPRQTECTARNTDPMGPARIGNVPQASRPISYDSVSKSETNNPSGWNNAASLSRWLKGNHISTAGPRSAERISYPESTWPSKDSEQLSINPAGKIVSWSSLFSPENARPKRDTQTGVVRSNRFSRQNSDSELISQSRERVAGQERRLENSEWPSIRSSQGRSKREDSPPSGPNFRTYSQVISSKPSMFK